MLIADHKPIILSTSVVLAESNGAPADVGALSNPYLTPMLLDEIRFVAYPQADEPSNVGGTVRAKFRMGNIDLTNGYIPIWNFGPQLQESAANKIEWPAGIVGAEVAAQSVYYSQFVWKLPRPLWIDPGAPLVPDFIRMSDPIDGDVTVRISYVARVLPADAPKPELLEVPYVTSFIPEAGVAVAESSQQHLRNPFQNDLHVQRFIGRIQVTNGGVSLYEADASYFTPMLTMSDSRNVAVVKDPTPFGHVFDFSRRAWTFNRELPGKEFFTAQLTGMVVGVRPETPMISMVGWRHERSL